MSEHFAKRMVDDALWVSTLEHRMTFVDGSRAVHERLAKICSLSRELTTFLNGRIYYGPPADNGAEVTCDGRLLRCEWIVCAVDGVAY